MTGLILAAVVVAWVARYVLKKYPPQPVLFVGGLAMMIMALIMGTGEILPAKDSTGSVWVDLIQFISLTDEHFRSLNIPLFRFRVPVNQLPLIHYSAAFKRDLAPFLGPGFFFSFF